MGLVVQAVVQEHQEQAVYREQAGLVVKMVLAVHQVRQGQVVLQEHQEHQGQVEHLALAEHQGHQERAELQVLPVLRVQVEHQEQVVYQVDLVRFGDGLLQ